MDMNQHPEHERGSLPWLATLEAMPELLAGILHAVDAHAIVAVTDRSGRIVYANDNFCRLSQYSREELLGEDHRILNSGTHPHAYMRDMWSAIGHGRTWHGQFCNRAKDGSLYWVQTTIVPVPGPDGRPAHYVSLRTDISGVKRAELALAASERRFRELFEQSADALLLLDIDAGVFVDCNQAAADMLALGERSALTGLSPAALSPPTQPDGRDSAGKAAEMMAIARRDGNHRFEWWHCSPRRPPFPVEVLLTVLRGESGNRVLTTWRDISTRVEQAQRIERLAYYDELTRLPNRALLKLRLDTALATARDAGHPLALLCIDLDRFKELNDSRGHSIGDRALVDVAHRFRHRLGETPLLARTGGDEFAVLLADADATAAGQVAETLSHSLQAPLQAEGQAFTLGASIGIALFPQDGDSAEDLLRKADIAMYRAKSGGGGHCCYREDMGAALIRQLDIAARLQRALTEDRLQLHYQPLLSLRDRRLVAAEVLLRWQEPDEGWMSPSEFVPVAEARNMMAALGGWVFRHACRQLRVWRDAGLAPPVLAINLSAQQFADPGLLQMLQDALDANGLPAAAFELELTESSVMTDPDGAVRLMNALAERGFALAIDDFGTGYSSLTYLKRFPAQKLKIDMSFVREMLVDRNDRAIVETIIAMAGTLQLRTVAEGVETPEQAELLGRLGCDIAQGWLFAKAMSAPDFARQWLAARG